jgi:hypothetical protein
MGVVIETCYVYNKLSRGSISILYYNISNIIGSLSHWPGGVPVSILHGTARYR